MSLAAKWLVSFKLGVGVAFVLRAYTISPSTAVLMMNQKKMI